MNTTQVCDGKKIMKCYFTKLTLYEEANCEDAKYKIRNPSQTTFTKGQTSFTPLWSRSCAPSDFLSSLTENTAQTYALRVNHFGGTKYNCYASKLHTNKMLFFLFFLSMFWVKEANKQSPSPRDGSKAQHQSIRNRKPKQYQ